MKVTVHKFFNKGHIEHEAIKLVSSNSHVYCVDEYIQKRLELVGIPASILHSFQRAYYSDEPSWEKVYQLSDELGKTVEYNDDLKYSCINFLTFEHNIVEYVLAVKFARLCQEMKERGCETLTLILTEPFNTWLRDINTSSIKTIRYGGRPLYRTIRSWVGRCLPSSSKKSVKHDILFVVTSSLYTRPALSIGDECVRQDLSPYYATDDRSVVPMLKNVKYSLRHPLPMKMILDMGKVLSLPGRLKRHIELYYDDWYEPDGFSERYLCQNTLLRDLPQLCYSAVNNIIFLERLIKEQSPELICVMPQDRFIQQIAWKLAKKYNIPTLACSAALETNPRSYMGHLHADKIAVMGDRMRDMYANTNKLM